MAQLLLLLLLLLLWEHLPLGMVASSHGRKADVEHVLKDWPSNSVTCAESAARSERLLRNRFGYEAGLWYL